jgi:hypothetical protein
LRGLVAWGGRPNRSRITYWIGGTKLKQQRRRANATDERRAALFRALPACQPQLRWQTRPRPRPNIVRGPAAYHHPKHYRQTLTSWHAFTCRTRPPHVSYVTRLKPRRVLVRSILQTPGRTPRSGAIRVHSRPGISALAEPTRTSVAKCFFGADHGNHANALRDSSENKTVQGNTLILPFFLMNATTGYEYACSCANRDCVDI